MKAYQWMVKGFGGIMQTLTAMSEERVEMDLCTFAELQKWFDAMKRVIEMQKRIQEEHAAK